MAEVTLANMSKSFGARQAVADLSLHVPDGEILVLLGPTGAGKTTTLRLIAGLETPDAGRVLLDGRDVTAEPPAARDVALVFQQYSLYPHLSVYDNLAFPLRSPARRMPEDQIRARVGEIASLLHIEDKLGRRVTALSGGQMQRVSIGRALVRRPKVYLMDEPLSSLDAKLRAELRVELRRLQRELKTTIVYVTHDQIEAMTLATHIGVLDRGRLVQLGTPREVYEDPVNSLVAARLGSPPLNLIPVGAFPGVAVPAAAATFGVRTEHVRIRQNQRGRGMGRVQWIEHLGDQSRVHVRVAESDVVTLHDPDNGISVGDAVDIEMRTPLLFDIHGERVRA